MAIEIEKPIQVFPGYEQLANVLQDALDQAQAGKGSQRHANGKPFLEQPIITDGRACGLAGPAFQARKKILEALNCPDEDRAVQDLLAAIVYTAAMVILKEEERQKREECPMVDAETIRRWQTAISKQEAQVRAQVETSAQAKDTARDAMATSLRYAAPKPQFRGDDPDFGIIAIDGKINPSGSVYTIPPVQDGDDDPAVVPEVVCTACEHHFFSDSENGASILNTGLCLACCKDFGVDPPVRMPPETVLPLKPLPDECLGALCGRARG